MFGLREISIARPTLVLINRRANDESPKSRFEESKTCGKPALKPYTAGTKAEQRHDASTDLVAWTSKSDGAATEIEEPDHAGLV